MIRADIFNDGETLEYTVPRILWGQEFRTPDKDLLSQKKKLEEVLHIEIGVQQSLNLHKTIDFAIGKAVAILEADKASFLQADPVSGEVCVKGHQGIDENRLDGRSMKLGDGINCLLEIHGEGPSAMILEEEARIGQVFQSGNFLSVPIHTGVSVLGIMNISSKRKGNFNDFDLRLLRMIVRQMALALENARLNREVEFWRAKDEGADVYNYRHCCCLLDYEIARCKRYKGGLSVLLVDIDGFRKYNDAFGAAQGDGFLREFGQMLKGTLRQSDTICRYVGDEFVIVLPETSEQEACTVAEKICRKTSDLSVGFPASVSVGVAQLTEGMDRYGLLRKADATLGLAKKKGKGHIGRAHENKGREKPDGFAREGCDDQPLQQCAEKDRSVPYAV